ncbi:hypothetical protein [Pleurocapsa sp. CCALA 161]|nr:hypothetical protein [Pleurocapsa sp. CCALA 161]
MTLIAIEWSDISKRSSCQVTVATINKAYSCCCYHHRSQQI